MRSSRCSMWKTNREIWQWTNNTLMHIIQCVGPWHAYSSSGNIDAWEREYFSPSSHGTRLFWLLRGMVCILDTILLYYKFAYMWLACILLGMEAIFLIILWKPLLWLLAYKECGSCFMPSTQWKNKSRDQPFNIRREWVWEVLLAADFLWC